MRSFYKSVEVFRDKLELNPDVHTVMFGKPSQAEISKVKNIYPLVVLNPTGSNLDTPGVAIFTFTVTALDVRDISKNLTVDKFLSNDNEIDNLNLTHSILNLLVKQLRNTSNQYDLEVVSVNSLFPLEMDFVNLLDGWELDITIQIPNISIDPCKDLTPLD